MSYSPWGCKKSDKIEHTHTYPHILLKFKVSACPFNDQIYLYLSLNPP